MTRFHSIFPTVNGLYRILKTVPVTGFPEKREVYQMENGGRWCIWWENLDEVFRWWLGECSNVGRNYGGEEAYLVQSNRCPSHLPQTWILNSDETAHINGAIAKEGIIF